ncbi:uncharacterized protein LOC129221134 [Uloborus diversus]|uniref:uncharacterized protein LOC129221134 n=1 Tax=Uloborus diversus TaxID=327109 RepID=UPI0024094CE2|nr:uncharacterized protein LOC129221134 [Uloborus diversus]
MVDVNPVNPDLILDFQENERPPSEQLVELHLYLVPKEKWLEKRKLAKNQAVDHTISVGFVRVLPQTFLSDLRKEMDRQLGIESVPQNYVFLRSVGRNFTQVRPKQEMEMKVKNYIPPYAPEPELYLKEGHYTGPSTWSQGEDSGLEESLADSNSQRSHDRATPESLTDEQLVLPKLADFLDVPVRPDLDEIRACMPPGAMTVSMSADDLSSPSAFHRARPGAKGQEMPRIRPLQHANHRYSTEDVRYTRRIREHSIEKGLLLSRENVDVVNEDYRQVTRGGSFNRRQKRGTSKERGGTQLPTWAETRTTRLRRSRALGEHTNTNVPQRVSFVKSSKKSETIKDTRPRPEPDAEDEAEEMEPGKVLMERIRANSRCLKAQLSSHHSRRTVADTGTAAKDHLSRERRHESRNGKIPNGVYTVHTRKYLRGGTAGFEDTGGSENGLAEIESTTVKLLDEKGREVSNTGAEPFAKETSSEEPDIVHHHTLDVDGQEGRTEEYVSERHENFSEALENISENGKESRESNVQSDTEAKEENNSENDDANITTVKNESYRLSDDSQNSNLESNTPNDLEEGTLVNRNGKFTIEVEVKELGSSEESSGTPAPSSELHEHNLTSLPVDDTGEFDSYRVYSEQNAPPADDISQYNRRPSRSDMPRNDPLRAAKLRQKEARGVYLRRMEHRNSHSNISRSNDYGLNNVGYVGGGSPVRRYGTSRSISQPRRSGQRRLEKWSSTAASTGDLREAAWDYSNDKERLLVILNEVRSETRLRQRQREELLRRIKQLQSRAHQRREQVREMWRKRYLEAKKITPRLEEECSRLRQELEKLHRELLAKVQAGVWALLTISGKTERPSNKLSYKIMIARLLQEIEDLTRRVEATRLKLHTEVKLRSMAEKDVRNLREELLKKKIQVTLTRNQEQAALGNGLRQQYFISAV